MTETLVVVKPLVMECLVAVLTLDYLYGEVTLSLMVGQTCLIPSLKGAARMVAVQSTLGDKKTLLSLSLLHIFACLFFVFAYLLRSFTLCLMVAL